MSDAETKSERGKIADLHVSRSAQPTARNLPEVRIRIIPLLITLANTALAGVLGWAMWEAYMGAPWTRQVIPPAALKMRKRQGASPFAPASSAAKARSNATKRPKNTIDPP
jgi:hypothetical protein